MSIFKRKRIKLFEDPNESASPEEKTEIKSNDEEFINQEEGKSDKVSDNTLNLGWYYSENKEDYQLAKISEKDRATHFYVVGATGTGKTKFLEYLIQQDIEKGNGFGVIDPHGDLIEDVKGLLILQFSPDEPELTDKVILIDPTDPIFTVTFNPLEKMPGVPLAEQANELICAFRKIWSDSWGVRMEDLMRNSLIALGEAGLTLIELPAFLSNRAVRQGILEKVSHPLAREYFRRFDTITDRSQITWIEPVMNKINAFFSDERIRHIFSSAKSSFNLREIMDSRKILLIKLDKGKLKDSADLLGSLLMAQIQMAAFSRSDLPQTKRLPFYLYIDEFQNFASESFSVVLSEARKYGLSLIMAHQTLAQIPEELRSLILGNAGIQVYFRLNRHDASILAKEAFEYSGFEVKNVSGFKPRYWSLGEEWEQHTKELQTLEPRICYVKHKIEGGVIPIQTAYIETAQEVFTEILGQTEEQFDRWFKGIPFGRKYLVERGKLEAECAAREAEIQREARPYQKETLYRKERAPAKPVPKAELPAGGRVIDVEAVVVPPKVETPPAKDKAISQHRYLQNLIKKIAEDKGYKATIELPVLDGSGRVDVSLERNGRKIACEISISSSDEQELKNVQKCLAAGYETVVLCSPDKKMLESIKVLVFQSTSESDQSKIFFFQPEDLLSFLEEDAAAEMTREERVKGYKVKVQYTATKEEEKKAKREAVAQVILQAMKRMKKV
ncbi:MAG: type IV secretion system DNA-binding domain-containing protein [Candidatus Aminicenantes bacterium]|nr:type IV secretion system DNA-binding domain-containing protein [Candidatus Aminicenantes bacterium]